MKVAVITTVVVTVVTTLLLFLMDVLMQSLCRTIADQYILFVGRSVACYFIFSFYSVRMSYLYVWTPESEQHIIRLHCHEFAVEVWTDVSGPSWC